ncbi:acyl-CoA synthetase [Variovorax paradoxus]|uniref:Long-chain-fatty-acid--CoA ligase n=1 Tax=Variovorax paradoxus TaxID=34073 RepID=A0A679J8V4_VARPD|nr:Long-chain-fatty-acid--CoA ligase [Variovorax paradoxus]
MRAATGIASLEDIRQTESAPHAAFMPHADVLDALEDAARQHPQRRAITFIRSADPSEAPLHWTHAQMVAQVRRAARAFTALCGDDEPRVAFLLPAIPEAYFTLWGAEAAGVACPINYLLGEAHIAELIDAARVNVLVALGPNPELDIWSRVPGLRERCRSLAHVIAVGAGGAGGQAQEPAGALDFDELLARQSDAPLQRAREPDAHRIAALFHTGGTTGRPKLAQHTHGNQLHAAWGAARMYGTTAHDVVLNGFPLFHVAGSFVYGLSTLLAGGEVVLPTLQGLRNTAFMQAYWRFVALHGVTLLAAVPTVMSTLLGVATQGEDLSRVRCLLTGGSPLPTDLADAFEQKTGIAVRNILGMTECGGVIAIEPAGAPRVAGSVGWPLPFTRVRVADDTGAPLAGGQEGILQIQGPNVGPGYTDAGNNAGVLVEGGWLVTGDVGRIDAQGRVFVTGRSKDLIIRSSHNIDPVVIEDALMAHPDVLLAAAVGAPDEYAGEVPVAYVSLRAGRTVDSEALAAFAQARIPERPAYPKAIFILDALPVTAIGKLYKPTLRAMAIRWVVEDRLARSALASKVEVDVRAEGKGLVVHCTLAGGGPDAAAQVRQLLGAFALNCRLHDVEGAGA